MQFLANFGFFSLKLLVARHCPQFGPSRSHAIIITITIGLKIFFIIVKIHVLTSFVVDNNDIKTTPV